MNGISGTDGSAVRLRESIQERLRAGRADRLTQAAVGIMAGGATTGAAADPAGVRHGGRRGEHHGVADPAGVAAAGAAGAAADPAGVAAVRGHGEAGEVEHHGEAGEVEHHGEAHEVEHHGDAHEVEHHGGGRGAAAAGAMGHLEVAIGTPGEVADPAGLAQATAVRGAAAYRRTREAAEIHAASPGISVAA